MPVTPKVLLSTVGSTTQTTIYTATGVRTIIDKFTATNYGAAAATLSVNLVGSAQTLANLNLIVKARTIQPGETYTFPEIVGHVLNPADFISIIASALNTINVRSSGREIS